MCHIFLPKDGKRVEQNGNCFVIVGANGSGKSRLGAWIEALGGGQRETHRISAQRALDIEEYIQQQPLEQAERYLLYGSGDLSSSDYRHKFNSRWYSEPTGTLLHDFDAMLATLFAHEERRNAAYIRNSREDQGQHRLPIPESRVDKLQAIWQYLIPHRKVIIENSKVTVSSGVDQCDAGYPGRHMSDGERVILYLVGQALCAPANSVFIVDEPEIHLHRAVRDRLWDLVQQSRADCIFVFITHDLEFAASRPDAVLVWVKSYKTDSETESWDWEVCPSSLDVPPELALEVLGSRRTVLFTEGDSVNSLDAKLYSVLFPDYYVLPVGGASTVDKCVHAFGAAKLLHYMQPCGIVDRDRRSNDEIAALKKRGTTCCPVAEVENLLILEPIFRVVATRAASDDVDGLVHGVQSRLFEEFERQLDSHVAQWAEAVIAWRLEGFSCKDTDPDAVQKAMQGHVAGIEVHEIYAQARQRAKEIVKSQDYSGLLEVFNFKGALPLMAASLNINVERYKQMALAAIREDAALRQDLAAMFDLGSSQEVGNAK